MVCLTHSTCIDFASTLSHAYIQRTLEREIRGCQHLILWTDGDREGENIADEIVEVITQGTYSMFLYLVYKCVS